MSALGDRLAADYKPEELEAMNPDELAAAVKRSIHGAEVKTGYDSAMFDAHDDIAKMEFPNLTAEQRADLVKARMMP